MKEAAEKWIPCTSTFPDYEICLGPFIAIRRVKAAQGSFKGKRIAIQLYKGQFWATLYDRFAKAKRVNILDMSKWASAAEWKRKGGKAEQKAERKSDGICKPSRLAASQPTAPPPPKPSRAVIEGWIRDIQTGDYAAFVKRNKVAEYKAMLAELDAVTPTPLASESPVNTASK